MNDFVRIGFWAPPGDLPSPVAEEWGDDERRMVLHYMSTCPFSVSYRGYSTCRICGCSNGSREVTDGRFLWPEGYAHYIEEHGVRPPATFLRRADQWRTFTLSQLSPEDWERIQRWRR